MSASQPDPTPQDVAAPTLEQLAKSLENQVAFAEAMDRVYKDAARYKKLCEHVQATSEGDGGNSELCFKVWIDWGNIPDGTDAEMLSAALDQL